MDDITDDHLAAGPREYPLPMNCGNCQHWDSNSEHATMAGVAYCMERDCETNEDDTCPGWDEA